MASDDWFFPLFLAILLGSVSLSICLWFLKRVRSGALIFVCYAVRAFCGLFVFVAGLFAWDLLFGQVALGAVLPFVGGFFLVGIVCMVPWGALFRETVVKQLAQG